MIFSSQRSHHKKKICNRSRILGWKVRWILVFSFSVLSKPFVLMTGGFSPSSRAVSPLTSTPMLFRWSATETGGRFSVTGARCRFEVSVCHLPLLLRDGDLFGLCSSLYQIRRWCEVEHCSSLLQVSELDWMVPLAACLFLIRCRSLRVVQVHQLCHSWRLVYPLLDLGFCGFLVAGFTVWPSRLQLRKSSTSCFWWNLIIKSTSSGKPISTGFCISVWLWFLFLRQVAYSESARPLVSCSARCVGPI